MHTHSIDRWAHDHVFLGVDHDRHERRTWLVVALTATMMVAEIIGGNMFGSMAVVADGWHMSTHATALSIAALSYRFARKHAHDPRFSFGTGKLGELAGFASAIILIIVALLIAYELVTRLFAPVPIQFGEATIVAAIGLAVNLLSARLLFDDHHQSRRTRCCACAQARQQYTGGLPACTGGRADVRARDRGPARSALLQLGMARPDHGHCGRAVHCTLVARAHRLGRRGAARYRSKPESDCRDPRTSRARGRPSERPSPVAPWSRAQRAHRDGHLAPSSAAGVLQTATGGD